MYRFVSLLLLLSSCKPISSSSHLKGDGTESFFSNGDVIRVIAQDEDRSKHLQITYFPENRLISRQVRVLRNPTQPIEKGKMLDEGKAKKLIDELKAIQSEVCTTAFGSNGKNLTINPDLLRLWTLPRAQLALSGKKFCTDMNFVNRTEDVLNKFLEEEEEEEEEKEEEKEILKFRPKLINERYQFTGIGTLVTEDRKRYFWMQVYKDIVENPNSLPQEEVVRIARERMEKTCDSLSHCVGFSLVEKNNREMARGALSFNRKDTTVYRIQDSTTSRRHWVVASENCVEEVDEHNMLWCGSGNPHKASTIVERDSEREGWSPYWSAYRKRRSDAPCADVPECVANFREIAKTACPKADREFHCNMLSKNAGCKFDTNNRKCFADPAIFQ